MKAWTVMVFMAGDNDLEDAAHADLFEMLKIGSGEQVDVVVQFDNRKDGTTRYHIQPKQLTLASDPLPETNVGDPAVLSDFIRWARTTYPAEHTLLVIWNHGTGWEDVSSSFNWVTIRSVVDHKTLARALFSNTLREMHTHMLGTRAIALDASSRDFLDNSELKRGLADALNGAKLDVLGLDACLMGMIEIGYQLRDQAHYLVASQEVEPHTGWPYDVVLQALNQKPDLTPQELSTLIVSEYGKAGVQARVPTKYTQAAWNLTQINKTFELTRGLVERLRAYPDTLALRKSVNEASSPGKGAKRFRDGNSVDMYDWAEQLRRLYNGLDQALKVTLDELMAHLADELVVANTTEVGDDRDRVHGASIYLPRPKGYNPLYTQLDFASTGWASFAESVSATLK